MIELTFFFPIFLQRNLCTALAWFPWFSRASVPQPPSSWARFPSGSRIYTTFSTGFDWELPPPTPSWPHSSRSLTLHSSARIPRTFSWGQAIFSPPFWCTHCATRWECRILEPSRRRADWSLERRMSSDFSSGWHCWIPWPRLHCMESSQVGDSLVRWGEEKMTEIIFQPGCVYDDHSYPCQKFHGDNQSSDSFGLLQSKNFSWFLIIIMNFLLYFRFSTRFHWNSWRIRDIFALYVSANEPWPTNFGQRVLTNESWPTSLDQRISANESWPTSLGQRISANESWPTSLGQRVLTNEFRPMTFFLLEGFEWKLDWIHWFVFSGDDFMQYEISRWSWNFTVRKNSRHGTSFFFRCCLRMNVVIPVRWKMLKITSESVVLWKNFWIRSAWPVFLYGFLCDFYREWEDAALEKPVVDGTSCLGRWQWAPSTLNFASFGMSKC